MWGSIVGSRLAVAIACGLVVAAYVAASYAIRLAPGEANDFTVHWFAARALIRGENPYESLQVGGRLIFEGRYFYPLTATLLAVPVAWLPIKVAATVFSATGATLLAYFLARERWRLAVLLSAPMLSTAAAGQNTSFLTLAALTPALGWLIAIKPNVGLAVLAMRPSKVAVAGALAFTALSLVVLPSWPRDWLHAVTTDPGFHKAPIMVPGGVVMLLALLRWRRPEARLLGVLSLVPHTMTWYDALPLMLIPSTFRELLILGILSHIASFVAAPMSLTLEGPPLFAATAPVALWGLYVPALLLVLRRRNEGTLPPWLERRITSWPAWLRGVAPAPAGSGDALPTATTRIEPTA
jgi:hypothetical protein